MTDESTRRTVLGGIAASAGLMSMIDATNAQAQASQKTFVLVHGAWHGGWGWRRGSRLLEKKGHKVLTPTLTGVRERRPLFAPKGKPPHPGAGTVKGIKWEGS